MIFFLAIFFGSFFLNQLPLKITVIYMHVQKTTFSTREKDLSYIEKVDVCLPPKTPKKATCTERYVWFYVFTANDNHSKKIFWSSKKFTHQFFNPEFFFVLRSSLKSDFIWSLCYVVGIWSMVKKDSHFQIPKFQKAKN